MKKTAENKSSASAGPLVLTIVLHAVLPFAWLVFAVFMAPLLISSLAELAAETPPAVNILFLASSFIARYSLLFIAGTACFLLADAVVYMSLLRSNRTAAVIWSVIVVITEIAATLAVILSVYMAVLTLTGINN